MPFKLPVACWCGQPNCTKHRRQDARPTSARRGYGHDWRKLREVALAREPLCRRCKARGRIEPAVDVHHTKRLRDNPHSRLDLDTLEPLCKSCHSAATAAGE